MIIKQVKEYGKKTTRQRIDINVSDNLTTGADVVILTTKEYEEIKSKLYDYNAIDKELQILKDQEQNLQQIVKDVTTPIHENYKKELQNKDKQINQLQDKLDTLKKIFNQFIISITSLSAWDIFFRGKHKDLISDFNSRIWITTKDNEFEDMDQPAIPGDEGKK